MNTEAIQRWKQIVVTEGNAHYGVLIKAVGEDSILGKRIKYAVVRAHNRLERSHDASELEWVDFLKLENLLARTSDVEMVYGDPLRLAIVFRIRGKNYAVKMVDIKRREAFNQYDVNGITA